MEISTTFMILVPVVVGVVQAVKLTGVSTNYIPTLAILLGILGVYSASGFMFSGMMVIEGIVVGLSAAGLYSGVKATVASE